MPKENSRAIKRWAADGRWLVVFFERATAVVGLSCFVTAFSSGADCVLALLPFGYLVILLVLGQGNIVRWTPDIVVLKVMLFLRFAFLPFAMCFTDDISVYVLKMSNIAYSVPLTLYELLAIGIALHFTARWENVAPRTEERKFGSLYYGGFIVVAALALMASITYENPYLISGFEFITQGAVTGLGDDDVASGIVVSIWYALLAWVYVWALLTVRKRSSGASMLSLDCAHMRVLSARLHQADLLCEVAYGDRVRRRAMLLYGPASRAQKGHFVSTTVPVTVLVLTAPAFKNSTYPWLGIDYNQALR